MSASKQLDEAPEVFRQAVDEMERASARSEIELSELPAPRRIAPHAHAISGDVIIADEEVGTGRFVLLHDPAGPDAWGSTFRCVTFAKAEIEQEIASDPLITDVGWSWLMDALTTNGAEFVRPAGSVTVVRSDSYGDMEDDAASAQIEIRASWSPAGSLAPHVDAWLHLLAQLSGLPPISPGVIPLHRKRAGR